MLGVFFAVISACILSVHPLRCSLAFSRINDSHSQATAAGWDYDRMIELLKKKIYTAVISDDTQLISRAYSDPTCSLHILSDSIEPFDLALAFSKARSSLFCCLIDCVSETQTMNQFIRQ